MKPEELRIGNYVNYGIGITDSVVSIDCCMVHLSQYSALGFDDIQGIPLTEEWFEKFGFKEVIEHYDGFSEHSYELTYREGCIDTFTISYDAEDFSLALFESSDNHDEELGIVPNANKARYVHQLQNLYYALTGEELNVRL